MSKRSTLTNEPGVHKSLRRRMQNAAFASLYRFGGRVYDPLTRFLFGGAWDRWRTSVISFLPDGSILDLGCGTGALVNMLNTMGYVAFGIDREPSMLRSARMMMSGARSRIVRGDAGRLPFRSASFDACVATFPSRFILQPDTLSEITRVVRPGGIFAVVLSGYTADWPLHRQPIRLALRLFYGERESQRLPEANLIAHPALAGEWHWLSNEPDHVLLWIGIRASDSAR